MTVPWDHYSGRRLELDRSWMASANCRGCDPEWFFPERGESTRAATAVCGECVVRDECLEYALASGEKGGIWGGLSGRQRRRLMAERVERAS